VYYVPELKRNVISISAFDKKGCGILFEGGEVHMRESPTDKLELVGRRDGALHESIPDFEAQKSSKTTEFAGVILENTSDMDLWHERLAHLGYDNMRHMQKKGVVCGMNVRDKSFSKDHFCDMHVRRQKQLCTPQSCNFRLIVNSRARKEKINTFFQVNSDLIGPTMQVAGIDGSRYAITFTEAKSRMRWLYTMKAKTKN
jgi:hypothetical protein